mgnify:CR=1 FL=1
MLLFLNSIGGTEIILIMLFILMFFGSKSIPSIARTLGKGMREIQHASNEIRNEIKNSTDQIKKDALLGNELSETIRSFELNQEQTIAKINNELTKKIVSPIESEVNQTIADIEKPTHIPNKDNVNVSENTSDSTTKEPES